VNDAAVRARFAKHFAVGPEKLGEYIRDNVVIGKVTTKRPQPVYFVTRSGSLVNRQMVLKQGASVFVVKDTGQPLFVQACGNPVVTRLPERVKILARALPSYQVLRPNEGTAALSQPALTTAALLASAPPPNAELRPLPGLVSSDPQLLALALPGNTGPGAKFPWFLPPLLVGAAHKSGGGGGGDGPPGVIPEPGGVAMVFATGALPVIGYGLRRLSPRRRSRLA
jgi:hypothetical protein